MGRNMKKIIGFLIFVIILLNAASLQAQNTPSQISDEQAHEIVLNGTPDDVKKLIQSGYDVNKVYLCNTLLNTAIKSILNIQNFGDKAPQYAVEKLKYLISLGADVNQETCTDNARIPLTLVLKIPMEMQGLELIAERAIEEKLNNENEYCDIAGIISKPCKEVTEDEEKLLKSLVHQSFDKTKKNFVPYLMEMMKILVSNGADVNKKDTIRNRTPLHHAVELPSKLTTEPLIYLIHNGANVNAKDINGDTPLFFAAGLNNNDAVRILISAGADTNIRNNEGLLYNQVIGYQNYKTIQQIKNQFNG